MSGFIPTVLGPGEGVFMGGSVVLVCQNASGGTLHFGDGGFFDVSQGTASTAEGGDAGTAVLNTIIQQDETLGGVDLSYFAPAGCYQERADLADGSDGRFLVRGVGTGGWSNGALNLPFLGLLSQQRTDGRMSIPDTNGGAVTEYAKIVAIAREDAVVLTPGGIAECWYDGWNGFGTLPVV